MHPDLSTRCNPVAVFQSKAQVTESFTSVSPGIIVSRLLQVDWAVPLTMSGNEIVADVSALVDVRTHVHLHS